MPRTPFAIMFAMTTFLALPVPYAYAQDSATDATTPMDKLVGNQVPPTDNTLSNDEVAQLKQQQKTAGHQASGTNNVANDPGVSGTTPVYKSKSGSAAATEGGVQTPE